MVVQCLKYLQARGPFCLWGQVPHVVPRDLGSISQGVCDNIVIVPYQFSCQHVLISCGHECMLFVETVHVSGLLILLLIIHVVLT